MLRGNLRRYFVGSEVGRRYSHLVAFPKELRL
jgi:hypothetical protein